MPNDHFNEISDRVMRDRAVMAAFRKIDGVDFCDRKAYNAAVKGLETAMDTAVHSAARGLNIRLTEAQSDRIESQLIDMSLEGRGGNGICKAKPATHR